MGKKDARMKPRHAFPAGKLTDHYDFEEDIIGVGSFGTISCCRHRNTGKQYAVKMITKNGTDRFDLRREMTALLEIDHPRVLVPVQVYDSEEKMQIVMPLCAADLEDLMTESAYNEDDARTV